MKISNKGVAVVEMAIILPILMILIFGIIEFGFIIYNKAMITNASREGARLGIVFHVTDGVLDPISDLTITERINSYLGTYLVSLGAPSTPVIDISRAENPETGDLSPGGTLTVDVSYDYRFLILNLFGGSGPTVGLGSRTVMRFE
jgi:Flp pilus assembly protein TadG